MIFLNKILLKDFKNSRFLYIPSDLSVEEGILFLLNNTNYKDLYGELEKFELDDCDAQELEEYLIINGEYCILPLLSVKKTTILENKVIQEELIDLLYKEINILSFQKKQLEVFETIIKQEYEYLYIYYMYNKDFFIESQVR